MGSLRLLALLASLSLTCSSVVKPPSKSEGAFELLILHNNDMHARFEQTSQLSGACTTADRDAGKCYGGFPRVAHVVKEARAAAASGQGPPVLYLNAGDTYTGTAWFTIYKWKIAAEFINALQPDAVSLGNDEFEIGTKKLSSFVQNLEPTVLASNVILYSSVEKEKIKKSVIIDVNGKKVGIVGYLSLEDRFLDSTGSIDYIDEAIAVKEEVENLKSQGVNIIIALGHSDEAKDMEIAREIDGIDLVIAGHKNSFFWNGTSTDAERFDSYKGTIVTQSSGKQVPVVQSFAYTKYLGKLSINFDAEGEITTYEVNPVLLDNTVYQDHEAVEILAKYEHEISTKNEEVVGTTAVVLDGSSCGLGECNLGNLVTDAMMYIYAINFEGERWTDAPVAIINAGSISASISPPNRPASVTRGDLLAALPSESNIVAVTVNGTILLQMLEHAVASFNPSGENGQFLQYSGVRVVFDMAKESGSRVVSAVVRCWSCFVPEFYAIDDWRDYKILMPASLADGGNEYSMLEGLPKEELVSDEVTYVSEYIQMRSPVYPEIAGRITLLNQVDVDDSVVDPEDSGVDPDDSEVDPEDSGVDSEVDTEETVDPEAPGNTDSAEALSASVTIFAITLLNFIVI